MAYQGPSVGEPFLGYRYRQARGPQGGSCGHRQMGKTRTGTRIKLSDYTRYTPGLKRPGEMREYEQQMLQDRHKIFRITRDRVGLM